MSKKIVIDLVYVREELADQRYDLTGYGPTVVDYDDALKAISNIENQLREEYAKIKQGHDEIKNKGGLIHNSMKLIASTEMGILERVLGKDNLFGGKRI